MLNTLDFFLLFMFLLSSPIYIILLVTLFRYRKKSPFNTSFFKITFSLGIFDLMHLFADWIIGRFANYGWLGMNVLVMISPYFFAKVNSMLWWFAGLGQTLSTLLLAANRLSVVAYGQRWTKTRERAILAVNWIIPVLLTIPQGFMTFDYHHINGTAGVIMYWTNSVYQWWYFLACFWWCGIIAVLSGICYGITFWKARGHRVASEKSSVRRERKAEIKLAFAGGMLFLMTLIYAIFCGAMGLVTDVDTLKIMLKYQALMGDSYSWINPYLLLICSSVLRKHFTATLFAKQVNYVSQTENTIKGNPTSK